jgi:hypothetical protein
VEQKPQIRFVLSRGFAISGEFFIGLTQGSSFLATAGLSDGTLTAFSISGFAGELIFESAVIRTVY